MTLASFSINRPVTTVMIYLGLGLFGIISLLKMPMELFPEIKYPQLTIFTGYANAAPQEVETLLTKPIEEAVGTASGIRAIRSISKEGVSLVFAEFDWDQNMDFASLRVREKVDLVKAGLPRDATEPLVVMFNPFDMPIMRLSVTGNRDLLDLRRIAKDRIKDELEKVEGVASASVEGGLEREILVDIDQGKLSNYNVPILTISDAITNSNLNYPAGTIKESFYEYMIRTLGEFEKMDELKDVVIASNADEQGEGQQENYGISLKKLEISKVVNVVLLKDVAEVKDTFKEKSSFSRYNRKENISISIQKQSQANTIQVVEKVRKAIVAMKDKVPKDIQINVTLDQSVFIKDAIRSVTDAAWQGAVLAFITLYIFLKNMKTAFIVTVNIPITVVIVFIFMYFPGISINIMSMGGLALGVGMMLDNAVVIIENIFRHKEMGSEMSVAAEKGTDEVVNAVIASTLTSVSVFLPMVFVIGIAGQLFKQISFTITFCQIISLVVAIMTIPLMSLKMGLGKGGVKSADLFTGGKGWMKLVKLYEGALRAFMKVKGLGLLGMLALFLGSLMLWGSLDKELMPKADQGEFMVKVDLPVGTIVEETNRTVERVEDTISRIVPEAATINTIVGAEKGESTKDIIKSIGSNQAQIMVALKDNKKRTTSEIVDILVPVLKGKAFRGATIEVLIQQGIMSGAFGGSAKPIAVEIKGEDLEVIGKIAKRVREKLEGIKGIFGIEDDFPDPIPEVRIIIDKDKAALYNLSVVDLARMAQTVIRGYIPSQFKEKGKEIDIRVVLKKKDRDQYSKIQRLIVNSPVAGPVPLSKVVKFEQGMGPSEIRRISQEKTITVSANVSQRKISDVNTEIEAALKNVEVEKNYRVRMGGESEEMKKSFASLVFAITLSILLVYMVMAAQFESITQPFIILFTVPLSIIGVILALYFTKTSVNVISLLGVVILGGIVVNNGIVLIDFTNLLVKEKGLSRHDAIIEAGLTRLRPIMMTAFSTVLGLFPMILASGRGAELQRPMAISVAGGMAVSTSLTLFVIPAIYVIEGEIQEKWRVSLAKVKSAVVSFRARKNKPVK
ncbi:MAG: efflux RND transporter permease subunit [Candidatus Omnitrophica bacterium]|nr:efflux RND transporter permease subunit [Candidatus Omnitrophota bacterium]